MITVKISFFAHRKVSKPKFKQIIIYRFVYFASLWNVEVILCVLHTYHERLSAVEAKEPNKLCSQHFSCIFSSLSCLLASGRLRLGRKMV